jgi:hypothetical protein
MRRTGRVILLAAASIVAWEFGLRPFFASPIEAQAVSSRGGHHEELARMFAEDQADRNPAGGRSIDWAVVRPRDKRRLARVREMYRGGDLRTGKDYYHAAMILQHSDKPSDYLLAHEFCVVAIGKGEDRAKWLAAASEDRYLMDIGRPQRFGTQYRASGPMAPFRLHEVDDGVTDGLRREFNTPTLEQARAREAKMNN